MCEDEFENEANYKQSKSDTHELMHQRQGGAIVPLDRKKYRGEHAMCPNCLDICDASITDFMKDYGDLVKVYHKRIKQDIKLSKADTKTKKAKILLDD